MRLNLGPSGANRVAENCFRLLRLVSEVQNDVEVVKPVLEELEVMRLSCALGMLSSVNAKDFEFEMLEAQEFDEDFARFLRQKVFSDESADGEDVQLLCLFGTQQEVKRELVRLGSWSDACERNLLARDQGIYCVHKPEQESGQRKLILFAWLQDVLFETQRLRDTATYILRFLTCLSSHVVCCLSGTDIERIQEAVASLSTSEMDEWQSYSVAFHVERQEDEKDAVHCKMSRTMRLPAEATDATDVHIVKGSFPAVAFVKPAPTTKSTERSKENFHDAEMLVRWVVDQADHYNLVINGGFSRYQDWRDLLLKATDSWPAVELQKIEDIRCRSTRDLDAMSSEEVDSYIEDLRCKLSGVADTLFSVDVLLDLKETQEAVAMAKSLLDELSQDADVLSGMGEETLTILALPLRLKHQMGNMQELFESKMETELNDFLKKVPTTRSRKLKNDSKKKSFLSRMIGLLSSADESEAILSRFRERMNIPLEVMKQEWWNSVHKAFDVYRDVMPPKWSTSRKKSVHATCDEDVSKVLQNALRALQLDLQHREDTDLVMKVDVRKNANGILCDVQKERWNPATRQVHVLKVADTRGEMRSLGVCTLKHDASLLRAFSVKNHCVLLVTVTDTRTIVDNVQCSPYSAYSYWNFQSCTTVRSFGRLASLCDFNVKERVMAFAENNWTIALYRFDENFKSMECMRTIETTIHSSLSLPLVDLLVLDEFVFGVDHTGAAQSINLCSRQTSRKIQPPLNDSGDASGSSSLFSLLDGLALGKLNIRKLKDSFQGELAVISSEDHRSVPVSQPTSIELLSAAVSVQSFGNLIFVLDALANRLQVIQADVTVRSDSYRIRHSTGYQEREEIQEGSAKNGSSSHWLWVIYHMYEKYPVNGLVARRSDRDTLKVTLRSGSQLHSAHEVVCERFVHRIMDSLKKLNKPLGGLDLVGTLAFRFSAVELDDIADFDTRSIRTFLQDVVTFVPVQVCRAEANMLTVLTNGQTALSETGLNESKQLQAADIAKSMRFGLLSPLLSAWRGRCVVVTSMGKQSTGKSYFLNHLTGSSFAIAGARCTDGAWMAVRVLSSDVLLVVLDFEGLGSFERTEQEDVFLSVLNASLSMFTIFRMEMRFDKEIDDLFTKFQKGVQLIKNDPRLFRGKLYMSVKDVNPNDQKGVLGEFVTKFQRLLEANKEKNFLTDLYRGQLDINCSPPLGTFGYYQSLMHAQRYIERSLCGDSSKGFSNGKMFLDCMRLVLAKISILDWTSLDESAQQLKLIELRNKLPSIVRTGCFVPQEYVSSTDRVNDNAKEDLELGINGEVTLDTMCAAYPAMAKKWRDLSVVVNLDGSLDREIDLQIDCSQVDDKNLNMVGESLHRLFELYLQMANIGHTTKLTSQMQSDFDVFLAFVVRRRKSRIASWALTVFGDYVPEEWKQAEQLILGRFQTLFSRCQHRCDKCQLGCMESAIHSVAAEHKCGLGHTCRGRCEFCDGSGAFGKTPGCSCPAGHEGNCECEGGDHTCGKPCCMSGAPNCGKLCTLKPGHTELHRCAVKLHVCGEPCGAKNCCGRCILNVELPHSAHKCVEVRCMEKCFMDGCEEHCSCEDHFHGQLEMSVAFSVENGIDSKNANIFDASSDVPVIHMCSKEHDCQALCSEEGICQVEVFHKQSSKTFSGERGSFQYSFQEMNGSRKKCTVKLRTGQHTHQGRHSCVSALTAENDASNEDVVLHYCDARCPCCSYYCKKKFGHHGPHTTSHGNMRNTYFLSSDREIDIDGRKYVAGERGVAEMCNLYCSKMGREHVHYLDCEQSEAKKCVYVGDSSDKRRHCTRKLDPKPAKEVDELLHEQFWKTLGWEDPCTSASEREEFAKCAYKCDAPDHTNKVSHCVLPAWHKSEVKPSTGSDGFSYVSGHKFECSHTSAGEKMHHVFVLDCSGSMQGWPWEKLIGALRDFIYNRIAGGSSLDLVSVVTFDTYGQIEYEARNITVMKQAPVRFRGGGTTYAAGLRLANEVLSRVSFETYKPVVVFFSDGQPHDPEEGVRLGKHIQATYAKYGLEAFTVGFGSVNLSVLQRVATSLGGTYHHALSGDELRSTFCTISASLGVQAGLALAKPSHETVCSICQKDMACEETVELLPCKHELHKSCRDTLVQQTRAREKTLCPMCRREVLG